MDSKISIIIVTHNSEKFIDECLASLITQRYKAFEIIVVDNCSKDTTRKVIERYNVRSYYLKENKGFCYANNYGVSKAKNDIVLLINADCKAPKDLLHNLSKGMIGGNAIVAAYDIPPNTAFKQEPYVPTMTLTGSNTKNVLKKYSAYGKGAALLINTKLTGGKIFDNDYFMYYEDNYLGLKTNFQGFPVCYCNAYVWHHGAARTELSPLITYYSERNRIMLLLTVFDGRTLVKLMPLLAIDLILRFLYYLPKPNKFLKIIKAILWNLFHAPSIIKKRNEFKRFKKRKDSDILRLCSYKLFPKYENGFIRILNKLVREYCKAVNLKTYELS